MVLHLSDVHLHLTVLGPPDHLQKKHRDTYMQNSVSLKHETFFSHQLKGKWVNKHILILWRVPHRQPVAQLL